MTMLGDFGSSSPIQSIYEWFRPATGLMSGLMMAQNNPKQFIESLAAEGQTLPPGFSTMQEPQPVDVGGAITGPAPTPVQTVPIAPPPLTTPEVQPPREEGPAAVNIGPGIAARGGPGPTDAPTEDAGVDPRTNPTLSAIQKAVTGIVSPPQPAAPRISPVSIPSSSPQMVNPRGAPTPQAPPSPGVSPPSPAAPRSASFQRTNFQDMMQALLPKAPGTAPPQKTLGSLFGR